MNPYRTPATVIEPPTKKRGWFETLQYRFLIWKRGSFRDRKYARTYPTWYSGDIYDTGRLD